MSSRILRGEGRTPPGKIAWQSVGAPKSPPAQPQGTPDAEEEIARRLHEARQTGFREGEAEARSKIERELERLALAIESLASLRPRLRREAEADLVRLSVAIARRILRREISVDPSALEGLILAALEKLQAQETHRVRVHPSHELALRACLERLGPARNTVIAPDPACEPGTLIFETACGNLDASIQTQLAEIERGLVDRLRRSW